MRLFFLTLILPFFSIFGENISEISISGTVKHAQTGLSLPAVKVVLLIGVEQIAKTLTDENGRYQFSNLLTTHYWVQIECASNYALMTENPVPVSPESTNTEVNFSLAEVGSITGFVTDEVTNQPVPNAIVEILRGSEIVAFCSTDENGMYCAFNIAPKPHMVRVRAPNYQTSVQLGLITAGQITNLDFTTTQLLGYVQGLVLHSGLGRPIAGASVKLFQNRNLVKSTCTDDNGGFNLMWSGVVELVIECDNFRRFEKEIQFVPNQTITFSAELCSLIQPPQSISGKVIRRLFAHIVNRVYYISWEKSIDPSVKYYRIYRNDKCIAEIFANDALIFKDPWRVKKKTNYKITAVNANGQESTPLSLNLK